MKAEMEEDVSIDGSPEEMARSLFASDAPVVQSRRGEGSKPAWVSWLSGRRWGLVVFDCGRWSGVKAYNSNKLTYFLPHESHPMQYSCVKKLWSDKFSGV